MQIRSQVVLMLGREHLLAQGRGRVRLGAFIPPAYEIYRTVPVQRCILRRVFAVFCSKPPTPSDCIGGSADYG